MAKPDEPREFERSNGVPVTPRRAYRAPELTEYGSVAKLTQQGSFGGGDFMGMMMMP
jgi:hypothetical protein